MKKSLFQRYGTLATLLLILVAGTFTALKGQNPEPVII